MTRNLGSLDRTLRILVGLVLLSLLFVLDSGARWFGLVGLVPLLTGLVGNCPLYSVFGFSSCPLSGRK
ncbi:DUF2892 domain-containing protein [Starkeya sp. 3C]|uniref:DUF2892 domain-containing protein n=1 Tax=Ancylobacter moscoviensis TaxID=2597768 RepID=A0ABY3DQR9_9HYPH|nr:DUF2892 domain-containing protein [Ancylobacter moscoviensis]TSJ62160.1 DUF2892 domain-containing protein [Ancylobacter moscoviensis]